MLHALPLPVAVFDQQLGFRSGNDAWQEMLHGDTLSPARPGTPFFDLFPETESTLKPLIKRALAGETVTISGLRLIINGSAYFWDIAIMPSPSSGDQAGFVCAITDVTERMLSNQLLTRRVADRTRKLSALYAILEAAANSDDLHSICATALRQGMDATHADAGAVLFSGGNGGVWRLLAEIGLPAKVSAALKRGPTLKTIAGLPYRSTAAPIVIRERAQGYIILLRRGRRPFGEEDEALAATIGDQLGVVIERALLTLETEQVIVFQERNRLARELHDAVTQSLYSLTLFAEASQRMAQSGDIESAKQYMGRVSETARQALREMRLLVHNLRPSALQNAGLEQALRQRIDAVERRAGINAGIEVEGTLQLPTHVEEGLYHIAQEALNNSLKHAGAVRVQVTLRQERHLVELAVRDDGRGFDPARVDAGGVGIASMRERAAQLGSELRIGQVPSGGTEVAVQVDLRTVKKPAGANNLQILLNRSAP